LASPFSFVPFACIGDVATIHSRRVAGVAGDKLGGRPWRRYFDVSAMTWVGGPVNFAAQCPSYPKG
jgi:hypothetical protein